MNTFRVAAVLVPLFTIILSAQGRPFSGGYPYDSGSLSNELSSEDEDNNIIKEGASRVAKYLFGSRSGAEESSSSSSSVLEASAKKIGLDINAVTEGVLKPDNIAIHVLQNTVNYFSSSLAWFILGVFATSSGIGERSSSSSSTFSLASPYNFHHIGKSLPKDTSFSSSDLINSYGAPFNSEPNINVLRKRQLGGFDFSNHEASSGRNKDNVIAIKKLLRRVVNSAST